MSTITNEITKSIATKMMFMVNYGKSIKDLNEQEYAKAVEELGTKWFSSSDNYATVEDAIVSADKYATQCLEVYSSDDKMADTFENKVNFAEFQHVLDTSDGDRNSILSALKALK